VVVAGSSPRLRRLAAALLTVAGLSAAPGAPALAQSGSPGTQTPASDDAGVLLLFDASKSMGEDAGGQTRMEAAKRATRTVVDGLPAGAQVGMRAYGSRVSESSRTAGCRDTRALVPVGPLDRDGLKAAVDGLEPTGRTPIGRSLRAAPGDFPAGMTRKTVVLVSDGGDNCAPPDPCAVARDVARQGVDLSIQVIGLQVNARVRRQLKCIARAGGGTYVDAGDPEALLRELRAALARARRTYDAVGRPVTGATDRAAAPVLGSGQYLDHLRPGEQRYYAVDVPRGKRLWVSGTLVVAREANGTDLAATAFRLATLRADGRQQFEAIDNVSTRFTPVGTAGIWGGVVGAKASGFWAHAGRYVFQAGLDEGLAPEAYPLELAVSVLPAGEGPGARATTAPAAGSPATRPPQDPKAAPSSAQAFDDRDGGGYGPGGTSAGDVLALVVVALAAAALGAGAGLVVRRRRTA
jgi:Ca-activated chloride channel homolog